MWYPRARRRAGRLLRAPSRPRTSGAGLSSVSCITNTNCVAVGVATAASGVPRILMERWNGTRWSIVASHNPPGSFGARLSSVSCTTHTNCVAVGEYTTAVAPSLPLVERWNGAKWSIVASPKPLGSFRASLSSVSCTTSTSCVAVGYYTTSGDSITLVEHWNGAKWSIITSPSPGPSVSSFLSGVSCTTATTCVAVGQYSLSSGAIRILVEHWNGTRWSIVASPNRLTFQSALSSVSCATAANCVAVGSSNTLTSPAKTIAQRWNGNRWSIIASPNPTASLESRLVGVSCTAAKNCVAVGQFRTTSDVDKTLVERLNGNRWSISPSPSPSADISLLAGVSCASSTTCFAVGGSNATVGETLTERYG